MISEDLLQDTFVKIWKHIDLYDAGKGSLYTWMLNIAKNTSIDYKRSKQSTKQVRTARIYHSDINMSRFHILPDIDNIDLKSIVSKLDKKYSEVLNAMFWSGYNQDQAAKYLDLPLGTIKTRVRKGLQILRTQVSPA